MYLSHYVKDMRWRVQALWLYIKLKTSRAYLIMAEKMWAFLWHHLLEYK